MGPAAWAALGPRRRDAAPRRPPPTSLAAEIAAVRRRSTRPPAELGHARPLPARHERRRRRADPNATRPPRCSARSPAPRSSRCPARQRRPARRPPQPSPSSTVTRLRGRPRDRTSPAPSPTPGPTTAASTASRTALVLAGWDDRWRRPGDRRLRRRPHGRGVRPARPGRRRLRRHVITVAHAPGSALLPPGRTATVLRAAGIDGFYGGPLDAELRRRGCTHLLVAGHGLEGPVHSHAPRRQRPRLRVPARHRRLLVAHRRLPRSRRHRP